MNNKILIVLGALVLALSIPLSSVYAKTQPFPDVPATKHFAEAVNELAERNIIGGYPDGTFKPGNSITRGQAAAIIAKMTKLDTTNVKDPKFKDVTTANGYYKAIAALAEKGVIKGYADGRFGPNDSITRAQVASILIKAFELPLYNVRDIQSGEFFEDVNYKNSHRPGIYSLYQLGLTTGTTPTTYSPNDRVTRGQAAKLMKASEVAKQDILTLHAKDYKWNRFDEISGTYSDVFEVVVSGIPQPVWTEVHIVPKKEGKGTLTISANSDQGKKYNVHVKKVNDTWDISLDETSEIYSTPVKLPLDYVNRKDNEALIGAESVILSTEQGEVVNDNVEFTQCDDTKLQHCTVIYLNQPGTFIATVRYADGKEGIYWIKSTEDKSAFYYQLHRKQIYSKKVLEIKDSRKPLGRHVLPAGSKEIATVTRDPGTSVFHITPKKAGAFDVDFPDNKHKQSEDKGGEYLDSRLEIKVEQLGPYLSVTASYQQRVPHE